MQEIELSGIWFFTCFKVSITVDRVIQNYVWIHLINYHFSVVVAQQDHDRSMPTPLAAPRPTVDPRLPCTDPGPRCTDPRRPSTTEAAPLITAAWPHYTSLVVGHLDRVPGIQQTLTHPQGTGILLLIFSVWYLGPLESSYPCVCTDMYMCCMRPWVPVPFFFEAKM